jgi:3',5'-cyclic AMP phosphodiesterase CpdA
MLIAHISDLHIGRDAATDLAAARLALALQADPEAAVVVSGDVTHRGRLAELARFEALFRPLLDAGRVAVVPGNHDRLGDDVASALMPGARVATWARGRLVVVRIDSTAPHNRWLLGSHGRLTGEDLAEIEAALGRAPAGATVAAVLHHHLLPLPEDQLAERLASLVGLPCATELAAGGRLLELLRGRCDLVLHGHRHRPSDVVIGAGGERPLRVINAGSSTALGRVRAMRVRPGRGGWAERWFGLERPAPFGLAWRPAEAQAAA